MICLIDNYDSFTFNLVHYLGELGAEVDVRRNDKVTSAAVIAAESVADGLMAEAHAEDRDFRRRFRDQAEADAGLLGRAGAR